MTKDEIFGLADHRVSTFRVEAWEREVELRTWTGGERAKVLDLVEKIKAGKRNYSDLYGEVVVLSLAGPDGKPLLDSKDIPKLMERSAAALEAIFAEAMRLNGIGQQAEEKKSD